MVETIYFKGETYPKFQAEGFAAKFAFPFAKEICKGVGYDIGCNRLEWALPGARPIDLIFGNKIITLNEGREIFDHKNYHALNLPGSQEENVDYIFSSHCLEHLDNWVIALDYWYSKLKIDGILFLYLPDHSQIYWRPLHNRKHIHSFTREIIYSYFYDKGLKNIFISGIDLNNSFMIFGEK